MKNFSLALCLTVVALGSCTKDSNVRSCNPKTLLLKFTCGEDLAAADNLEFKVARGDGINASFATSLRCPGSRAYEVSMPTYTEGQSFDITATPTTGSTPAGAASVLTGLQLSPKCTSIDFPLTTAGGQIMPPKLDAAVVDTDGSVNDDGSTIPVDRGSKENGLACAVGPECMSGFCADGVCCEGSCKGTCEACNLQGSMGQCKPTPNGYMPASTKVCESTPAASCALDGKCNGQGECRKWPDGTVCVAGQCEGAGTRGRKTCKMGACAADNDLGCAPFGCHTASVSCFDSCESNAMCESGKACAVDADTGKKSCGKKPLGAVCKTGPECESANCADGVCCSTACSGACRSCNLVGTVGECKNIGAGGDDPHGVCKATDAMTCGQTGKCDGNGGCGLFAKGGVCSPAKCSGNDGVPASECDGNGSCVAGRPVACAPFTCGGNACLTKCTTNEQCAGGTTCVNGSCGLLPKGANCNTGTQCDSTFCVDGVCCDSGCGGTCQFCASATARGVCTDVAAGADDPRGGCKAGSTASCGNNGKCDGQKGCQKWAQGTECVGRSCDAAANKESFAKQCDGAGACANVKAAQDCAPYTCGAASCGTTCSRDDQCVAPNTCVNGLCGKRRDGQPCGNASQCLSNVCTQGVCCAGACSGTCKSCAVPGKEGSCENVASAQDPLNQCDVTSSSSCGPTGACDGAGKCAVHASGVICDGAKCSGDGSQEIGSATCDGGGSCKPPAAIGCQGNLLCSGASCKGSCATDADCRNGTTCNGRTKQCGKPNGQTCGGNGDCGSDKCADGFCCNSACGGACEACSGTATGAANGLCAPIPNGGDDGSCPGASCSNNAATPASKCNGARGCTAPGATSCGEFSCSAGTCLSSCSIQNPCSDGNKECLNGQCKKKQGVACGSGGECASGACPDGVCCNIACGGSCETCLSGTCQNVPAGQDVRDKCTAGLCSSGTCNGSGACAVSPSRSVCAAAACQSAALAVGPRTCDGGGTCVPAPAAIMCTSGLCKGGSCASDCSAGCAVRNACIANKCHIVAETQENVLVSRGLSDPNYAGTFPIPVWGNDARYPFFTAKTNADTYCKLLGFSNSVEYAEKCGPVEEAAMYYDPTSGRWKVFFGGESANCPVLLSRVRCQ